MSGVLFVCKAGFETRPYGKKGYIENLSPQKRNNMKIKLLLILFFSPIVLTGCDQDRLKPRGKGIKKRILSPAPQITSIPKDGVDTDLTLWQDVPYVKVFINGAGPFIFAIDTGSTGVIVSSRIAHRIKAKMDPTRTKTYLRTPNGRRSVQRIIIDEIKIGEGTFKKMLALVIKSNLNTNEHDFDGILGIELFRDCLLEIDYGKKSFKLKNKMDSAAVRENLIPASFTKDGIYIKGTVVDKKLSFLLDTGSSLGLSVSRKYKDYLKLKGESEKIPYATLNGYLEVSRCTLDGDALFGKTILHEPNIYLQTTNLFGGEALRDSILTINQYENYISIQPSTSQLKVRGTLKED